MFGLGTSELVLILIIVVIIFGVGKLPQIGEGMGKAVKGLKKGISEDDVLETKRKDKEEK